jgi:hypothetical protein
MPPTDSNVQINFILIQARAFDSTLDLVVGIEPMLAHDLLGGFEIHLTRTDAPMEMVFHLIFFPGAGFGKIGFGGKVSRIGRVSAQLKGNDVIFFVVGRLPRQPEIGHLVFFELGRVGRLGPNRRRVVRRADFLDRRPGIGVAMGTVGVGIREGRRQKDDYHFAKIIKIDPVANKASGGET